MPKAQTMSLHEYLAIGIKVIELEEQGKFEEAEKLEHTLPLPAYLAKWAKKRLNM